MSHKREGKARAYCLRLEHRVATLMAERDGLRQERHALRTAVATSFREIAERRDKEKVGTTRRTVAMQVSLMAAIHPFHVRTGCRQNTVGIVHVFATTLHH